jgi:hypothetical protein
MKQIKVDSVIRAVEELIKPTGTAAMPVNEPFEKEKSNYLPGLVYTALTTTQVL